MQGFIAASLPWRLCRDKNIHHIHYCSCSVSLSNNIQHIPECLFNCTCARIICTCSCKEQHCNTQGTATGWHQEQIATNPTTGTLQSISQWFFCQVPVLPAFLDQTLDVCRSDPPIHPRPKATTYLLSERYAARCCSGSVLPLKRLNFKALWPKRWNQCATAKSTVDFSRARS